MRIGTVISRGAHLDCTLTVGGAPVVPAFQAGVNSGSYAPGLRSLTRFSPGFHMRGFQPQSGETPVL